MDSTEKDLNKKIDELGQVLKDKESQLQQLNTQLKAKLKEDLQQLIQLNEQVWAQQMEQQVQPIDTTGELMPNIQEGIASPQSGGPFID